MRVLTSRRTKMLLATILIAALSVAVLPEIRCGSDTCVPAAAQRCWDGTEFLYGYKNKVGFDG